MAGRIAKEKDPKKTPKKQCAKCLKEKKRDGDFYADYTYDSINADKKLPICKECLWDIAGYTGDINLAKEALRKINRPFLSNVWESSINEAADEKSIFRTYIKNIQMVQSKTLTWKDSDEFTDRSRNSNSVNNESKISSSSEESYISEEDFNLPIDQLKKKWGRNFEIEDYYKLEDFYNKMMTSNKIETPQDETYLKKLAVISLKMDKELEAGNYSQVKQLGDLFSKYMADSKFRAMDQTDASKTGGLRTFSQIYAEVEKDGFIPPWEEYRKFKGLKQDIVDKTIMYILNYTLKLNKVSQLTAPPDDTPLMDEDEIDE